METGLSDSTTGLTPTVGARTSAYLDPALAIATAECRQLFIAARAEGRDAVQSLIRSKKFIGQIQAYVVQALAQAAEAQGVRLPVMDGKAFLVARKSETLPTTPFIVTEKSIAGGIFSATNQDVLVFAGARPALSLSLKSQTSSFDNNLHNFGRDILGETYDLHLADPDLVCGLLYMFPTAAPSSSQDKPPKFEVLLETYAKMSGRDSVVGHEGHLERACVLVVDFHWDEPDVAPEVLRSMDDFVARGLVSAEFAGRFEFARVSLDGFVADLVAISRDRYGW